MRRPSRVAWLLVQERVGVGNLAKKFRSGHASEQFADIVGGAGERGWERRPVAKIFRHRELTGKFGRLRATQITTGLLHMPSVAPGVGYDGEIGATEGHGDQSKAPVSEGRPRGEHLPGADRHSGGANTQDRTRPLAIREAADVREIGAEPSDTFKNGNARFVVANKPTSILVAAKQAHLDASRSCVDEKERRVVAQKLAEAGHPKRRKTR